MTYNVRPEFCSLMRQAHDSSNDVDNFDLYSEDPISRAQFEKLQKQRAVDALALIDFVVKNEAGLRETFQT